MAYVMTEPYKEPAIPSTFYYNGILEGYRDNGLPVGALKQAWKHCVKEVDQETRRVNRMFDKRAKQTKRRDGHER